jgi:hypothetical protein
MSFRPIRLYTKSPPKMNRWLALLTPTIISRHAEQPWGNQGLSAAVPLLKNVKVDYYIKRTWIYSKSSSCVFSNRCVNSSLAKKNEGKNRHTVIYWIRLRNFSQLLQVIIALAALAVVAVTAQYPKPSYPSPAYPKPSYPKPSYDYVSI